jgi:hypothetical protein
LGLFSPRLGRRGLRQQICFSGKVCGIGEVLVHRSEPEIGNAIERLQMLQDHDADVLRTDLGAADAEFFFNLGSEMVQLGHLKAEVLCGRAQTSKDFETIEGFSGPVSLDHNESDLFNAFEGREPSVAG